LVRHNGAEIAVPEGEKRRTLTAELWAVPLGTRPLWNVAVGSLLSDPSDETTQICERRNATAASVRKWKCGAEMGKILGAAKLLEDRGGEGKGGEKRRNLDVVVGAGGGEAVGGGVEVEAEHRLQVVPVDLHRPAPHPGLLPVFLLDRWVGFLPISLYLSCFARALSL